MDRGNRHEGQQAPSGGSEHFCTVRRGARRVTISRMGYYRFMMYGDDHQRAEDLGSRDLRDDADAQSFGYRVI